MQNGLEILETNLLAVDHNPMMFFTYHFSRIGTTLQYFVNTDAVFSIIFTSPTGKFILGNVYNTKELYL